MILAFHCDNCTNRYGEDEVTKRANHATNNVIVPSVQPMRIGLISDTHIPQSVEALPRQVIESFRGVDFILHAGDIYTSSVLDDLESIAPVFAAKGDDDCGALLIDSRVRYKHVIKVGRKTLWLIHMLPSFYTSTLAQKEEEETPDIIIFGHQHAARVKHYNEVLFVNPGSPTCPNYCLGLGTVAILDINSGEAQAHIVPLS